MNDNERKLASVISDVIDNKSLKKAVFSMPIENGVKKCEAALFLHKGDIMLCINSFTDDNKCIRKNCTTEQGKDMLFKMATVGFKRTNIITSNGDCSYMISSKGKSTLLNKIKNNETFKADIEVPTHNKEKQYILTGEGSAPFLYALGISDEKGKVFDRKTAKYRQINKFLEVVESIYPSLPVEGNLTICDFCCGKSYLTFAVYHYLTEIKKRQVTMYGVDLKKDVIEFCKDTANRLGYNGMNFICGDIYEFDLCKNADMVISLHACDIATDIVLINAVRLNAKIILSTPCCHHELNNQLNTKELGFINRHSILKQKLADAATDSLRALMLEACGYEVNVFELIDPEETPKNVMIRAVYKNTQNKVRLRAYEQYKEACLFLGVKPFIDGLKIDINQYTKDNK